MHGIVNTMAEDCGKYPIWNSDVGIDCLKPFGAGIIFVILAHPVYKIRIIQEPNTLELWNKLHFEEEKMESIYHV